MIGQTVTFKEGNTVPYYQDRQHYVGVPAGIPFTIAREIVGEAFWLRAKGYGEIGTMDGYGNGAIWVSVKDVEANMVFVIGQDE